MKQYHLVCRTIHRLDTSHFLVLKKGTEKKAKNTKSNLALLIRTPPFIISLNSLIVEFLASLHHNFTKSVSSFLDFDNSFLWSWILISCYNLSLVHLSDFRIPTIVQTCKETICLSSSSYFFISWGCKIQVYKLKHMASNILKN